jgi:hypothetical protein
MNILLTLCAIYPSKKPTKNLELLTASNFISSFSKFSSVHEMKKSNCLILLLFILTQCKPTQTINQMTNYEYVDGSGSTYSITATSIEFKPISAKESSTGFFNAGEPYQVKIDKSQFESLKQVFEKSIANKAGQTEQRSKGTGKLIVLPEKLVYIFEMNSVQKKEIDEAIKLLTKR